MLHLGSVGRRFGSVEALRDVSLDIGNGDFVALLGPSGCGKSTLLRLIAGLDQPQQGTVQIDMDPLAAPSHRGNLGVDRRASVAYVFQDAHLLPWRTVLDNVALPLE